jgi:PEP-CTERM motif
VPEPSTWTMIVLGFAGLAFAGRMTAKRGAPLSA